MQRADDSGRRVETTIIRQGIRIGLRPRCERMKIESAGRANAPIIASGVPTTPSRGTSSSESPMNSNAATTAPMMNGTRLSAYLTDLLIIR